MFERFTDRARRAIVLSQEETRRLGHNHIGTEHLLLGLCGDPAGMAGRALAESGIDADAARAEVEALVGRGDSRMSGNIPFTAGAKKALELALRSALELGHSYIGTEHVLLGVLREAEGPAGDVLRRLGAEPADVEARVLALVAAKPQPPTGALPVSPPGRARRLSQVFRSTGRAGTVPPGPVAPTAPGTGRLTVDARRVLLLAESEALRLRHPFVGEVHLLLGVLAEGEGRGARALAAVGVTLDGARAAAARAPVPPGGVPDPITVLPAVGELVELAVGEAAAAGLTLADSGHLLLALARQAEAGGDVGPVLEALGTTPAAVRAAVDGLGPAA